jgi:hypothetical protein
MTHRMNQLKTLQNENTDLKVKIIMMASKIAELNKTIKDLKNPYI